MEGQNVNQTEDENGNPLNVTPKPITAYDISKFIASTTPAYYADNVRLEYKFEPKVKINISKNVQEVIINFLSISGAFKFGIGSNTQFMSYYPKRIVFRFPGEFTVDDERPDGEIVIQMDPITENDSKVIILTLLSYLQYYRLFLHQMDLI